MDAATRPALLDQPIFVGTSPAGVEYWARREGDVARLEARLAHHAARAARQAVKRVPLSRGQADRVWDLSEESLANFRRAGVVVRATYVQGPQGQLDALADMFDPGDAADVAGAGACTTDAQVLFAERAGYAAVLVLQAKLRGQRCTVAQARRMAAKALV